MTGVDRWLQRYRIRVAQRWIPAGARVLDVGCHQGELLNRLAPRIREGVGIDPLAKPRSHKNIRIVQGTFPQLRPSGEFDVITMLAVLEHLPEPAGIPSACRGLLPPGGRLIITIPSPAVDRILSVLLRMHLIHGMSLDEHHGFQADDTVPLFESAGLRCICARRFQCGLNNLLVFESPGQEVASGLKPPPRAAAMPALAQQ